MLTLYSFDTKNLDFIRTNNENVNDMSAHMIVKPCLCTYTSNFS